jgi:hypothetical protein
LIFGQFRTHVTHTNGITGATCTEKVLPLEQPKLYVVGKIAGGVITRQDGMLGKILLSTRGREGLIGATKNAMLGSYIGAGVAAVAGILAMIFAPPLDLSAASGGGDGCKFPLQDAVNCVAGFTGNDGLEMQWKVKDPGIYSVTIEATGKDEQLRLWPEVIVLKNNEVLAKQDTDNHKSVVLSGPADAGNYAIHVQDVSASHVKTLKGGVHFRVTIKKTGPLPAASASASASASGPKLDKSDACPKDLTIGKAPFSCAAKLDAKGVTFTWKVDKKGHYAIVVGPADDAAPFTPKFSLVDAKNKKTDSKPDTDDKTMSIVDVDDLAPGTYKIIVNDADPKHAVKPEAFAIAIEAE